MKKMTPKEKRERLAALQEQENVVKGVGRHFLRIQTDYKKLRGDLTDKIDKLVAEREKLDHDYERSQSEIDKGVKALQAIKRERKRITVDPKLAQLAKLLAQAKELQAELDN